MSKTEARERLRRARLELEPLVKDFYELNAVLNALTKLEAEVRGEWRKEHEDSQSTGSVVQK